MRVDTGVLEDLLLVTKPHKLSPKQNVFVRTVAFKNLNRMVVVGHLGKHLNQWFKALVKTNKQQLQWRSGMDYKKMGPCAHTNTV